MKATSTAEINLPQVYAFDPTHPHSEFQAWNGKFKPLKDMPRKRARHASVVVDGNLCVFGGRNETDHLIAEVDCYDPSSDDWTVPTSLPTEYQTSDHTAFVAEGSRVYLVGGWDQDYIAFDQVTVVDMSDPDDVSYSDGPRLQARRGDIDVAVTDNGDAYVSGGFTDENNYDSPLNSVERFRPSDNEWTNVQTLNEERGDKQLVAMNGRVYAIGGEDKVDAAGPTGEQGELGARSAVLDSVEVLDPTEDVHAGLGQWKTLAGMPGQLFRFAAAGWEADERGYIFVFGGQLAYESECRCFKTTDKVMVFDVGHAELGAVSPGSGAGGSGYVWNLPFALAGLLWLTV